MSEGVNPCADTDGVTCTSLIISCGNGEIITGGVIESDGVSEPGFIKSFSEVTCFNPGTGSTRTVKNRTQGTGKFFSTLPSCPSGYNGIKYNQFLPNLSSTDNKVISNGIQTIKFECSDPAIVFDYPIPINSGTGFQLKSFDCPKGKVLNNMALAFGIPNPTTVPPPLNSKDIAWLSIKTDESYCIFSNAGSNSGDNNNNSGNNNNNSGNNNDNNTTPNPPNNRTRNIIIAAIVIIIAIIIIIVIILFVIRRPSKPKNDADKSKGSKSKENTDKSKSTTDKSKSTTDKSKITTDKPKDNTNGKNIININVS